MTVKINILRDDLFISDIDSHRAIQIIEFINIISIFYPVPGSGFIRIKPEIHLPHDKLSNCYANERKGNTNECSYLKPPSASNCDHPLLITNIYHSMEAYT